MNETQSRPGPAWRSWLACCPVHRKVVGLIPSQGTCLGCGVSPELGQLRKATSRCFSLTSMFLPSFSLSKIDKSIYIYIFKKIQSLLPSLSCTRALSVPHPQVGAITILV